MPFRYSACLLLMPFAVPVMAASVKPAPTAAKACANITSDAQRLACYDKTFGHVERAAKPETASAPSSEPPSEPAAAPLAPTTTADREQTRLFALDRNITPANDEATDESSLLDSRWELDPDSKLGTFNLRGYKPVYLMPVFYTNDVNDTPHSPTPSNDVHQSQHLDNLEAKFQISFKTKLWQGVFGDKGDLWFGYTQSSRWQVYNERNSRPFRETNYEPEFLMVFDTDYDVLGWNGHMFGIGINHQSNGRSDPRSRSWNRIIANFGFERPGWTIMFRPWIRINEPSDKDNNPDIADYMGRAQVNIVHEVGGNEFSLVLRHSLRTGSHSHGSARLSWAFPIAGKLRGYFQVFHGYGESLIDYNHKATYVGAGVSLLGWY